MCAYVCVWAREKARQTWELNRPINHPLDSNINLSVSQLHLEQQHLHFWISPQKTVLLTHYHSALCVSIWAPPSIIDVCVVCPLPLGCVLTCTDTHITGITLSLYSVITTTAPITVINHLVCKGLIAAAFTHTHVLCFFSLVCCRDGTQLTNCL